jgi:LmbE family N-acetylglucosaminyl deacetylase
MIEDTSPKLEPQVKDILSPVIPAKPGHYPKNWLLGLLIVLVLTGILLAYYYLSLKPNSATGQLSNDIETSHSVMWIGAHADDEMFVAGTLGYLCKDKNYHCSIVSFGASPKMTDGNAKSASFLNNADYIRIQERLKGVKNKCEEKNYDCFVSQWQENGSQAELVKIFQEQNPEIVFTFGTSQEYGAKDIHAATATIAEEAMRLTGGHYHHYYALNTMHLLTIDAEPEIKQATDIIDLNSQWWGYRMEVIGIYAPFYNPNDLLRMVNDKTYQDTLLHRELFVNRTPS